MFKSLFGSFCESAVTVAMMSVIFKRDHFLETHLTFARRQALKLFDARPSYYLFFSADQMQQVCLSHS